MTGTASQTGMGELATLGNLPTASVDFLQQVDRQMLELVQRRGGRISAAAIELLASGGKRMRPLMVLAAQPLEHAATGSDNLVRAAAAVELIHTASLVHDDLLDSAPLRRGRQTIASEHGPQVAVAVGDLLFSLAFATLVECRAACSAETATAAVQLLAETSRTLAEGEALQSQQARNTSLTVDAYLDRCTRKTGVLFGAALQLGALFGQARDADRELLGRFGCQVGLAFQLTDDVLDCLSPDTAATLGKELGTDVRDGTMTLPLLLAAAADERIEGQLRSDTPDVRLVLGLVAGTDAIAKSIEQALAISREATLLLGGLDGEFDRQLLEGLAGRSVHRIA